MLPTLLYPDYSAEISISESTDISSNNLLDYTECRSHESLPVEKRFTHIFDPWTSGKMPQIGL
jgi:hypothetical protein